MWKATVETGLCCYCCRLRQVARYSRDNWPQVLQDLPCLIAVAAGHKLCATVGGVGHFIVTSVFRLQSWVGEWVSGCTADAISAPLNGFRCARLQVTCDSVWQQQATSNRQQATTITITTLIVPGSARRNKGINTDNNVGLLTMTAKDALATWNWRVSLLFIHSTGCSG